MSFKELKAIVISALEELKANDIVSLDVTKLCDFTDIMVICSGTSNRHIKSLANNVVEKAKENGVPPIGVEGDDQAEWVLVDLGDVIVNIMDPETREFYQLEQLWDIQ